MRAACALALALALPASAQDVLDAAAFEAATEGRIMLHREDGQAYGAEQYLPGRRVIWQDAQGCMRGHWRPEDGLICFTYDEDTRDWCWSFSRDGAGLTGFLTGGDAMVTLEETAAPLTCPPEDATS